MSKHIAFSTASLCLFFLSLLVPRAPLAQEGWSSARADSHAPLGVMGDHTHEAGEFMLSYRYMHMSMEGNRSGTDSISTQRVLQDFMVAPTSMDMDMHMLGGMFAPNDWLTLTLMIPFLDLSMEHQTRMGSTFSTKSSGLGDIRVGGLVRLLDEAEQRVHCNLATSLPSGEIDERGDTPMGADQKLPYPMQLGSGTVDLLPGLTYLGQNDNTSWGAQMLGTVRLGENSNDYTLGNRLEGSLWGAYLLDSNVSSSLRLHWESWGNVTGADPDLNPMMVPTARPQSRGGERLDLGVGINFYVPSGTLRSLRIAVEFLVPMYQDLNGPQLENDWSLVSGVQMSF